MTIRPASTDDSGQLLAAYEWLFAPPGSRPPGWDPARARRALLEAIGGEGSTVLVAEEDGRTVGFCTAYIDLNSVRYGLRCWVEDLAVDPGRRSSGIGGALLREARRWAADRGATHLELDTGDARTDAQRFYERERPSWRGVTYAWSL